MADDRAYRVLVHFDQEHERYTARAPELDLEAVGETRAEALEAVEASIEAAFEAAATEGAKSLPDPVDVRDVETEFGITLALPLARELAFHAERSKMTPEALAEQLVARAVGLLNVGLKPPARARPRTDKKAAEADAPREADGNERQQERGNNNNNNNNRKGRGRGRDRRREGYRPEIEDQANFLAYVRDMEKGGGRRR